MTETRTTRPDLKVLDSNQCRVFCRDSHRIKWTKFPERAQTYGAHLPEQYSGLCSAGDTWSMQHINSRPVRFRLEHLGKMGWATKHGQFKIVRTSLWATHAHEAGDEKRIFFNCSHTHYPMSGGLAIGREEAYRQYEATLPREVRKATDAESMQVAINLLTEQGWDFVTDNKIRCNRCQAEEVELAVKLAELAKGDPR